MMLSVLPRLRTLPATARVAAARCHSTRVRLCHAPFLRSTAVCRYSTTPAEAVAASDAAENSSTDSTPPTVAKRPRVVGDIGTFLQAKKETTNAKDKAREAEAHAAKEARATAAAAEAAALPSSRFATDDAAPSATTTPQPETSNNDPNAHRIEPKWGKFWEAFPALRPPVDLEKLRARQQFTELYLASLQRKSKAVFKFEDVVKKNYRTILRSWPMVRLTYFQYGHDHFANEIYDTVPGEYYWNNQLAYPDACINIFCGTSAKGVALNVKDDPFAVSFDQKLYKKDEPKPQQLALSPEEKQKHFPHLPNAPPDPPDEYPDAPPPAEPPAPPPPDWKASEAAEERERQLRRYHSELRKESRKKFKQELREEHARNFLPEPVITSKEQSKARRLQLETEISGRPWQSLQNQGHREWDDRILFDPATMIRMPVVVQGGIAVNLYYYRDEVTPENTVEVDDELLAKLARLDAGPTLAAGGLRIFAASNVSAEPLFASSTPTLQKNTQKLRHALRDSKAKATSSVVDGTVLSSGTDASVLVEIDEEEAEDDAAAEVAVVHEVKFGDDVDESGKLGSYEAELALRASEEEQSAKLPPQISFAIRDLFQSLVAQGKLTLHDKERFYAEQIHTYRQALYFELMQGAMAKHADREERIVMPTYYYKYIKLNLAQGWIRFYTGKADFTTMKGRHQIQATIKYFNEQKQYQKIPLKFPFIWKYNEYKLSAEDLEMMRRAKWPPSLVTPPQSPFQEFDGGPDDQLAEYFEKTYLRFGNQLRFAQEKCFSQAHDGIEHPTVKYLRSVGAEPWEEDKKLLSAITDIPSDTVFDAAAHEQLQKLQWPRVDALRMLENQYPPAWQREQHALEGDIEDEFSSQLLMQLDDDGKGKDEERKASPDSKEPENAARYLLRKLAKSGEFVRDTALPERFRQIQFMETDGLDTVAVFDKAGNELGRVTGYKLKFAFNKIRLIRTERRFTSVQNLPQPPPLNLPQPPPLNSSSTPTA